MSTVAEQSMAVGLRTLRVLASSTVLDRVGLRGPAERAVYRATREGVRGASVAGRRFAAVRGGGEPSRTPQTPRSGLFDLTPTDEQQMLQEAMGEFGMQAMRPAALAADTACAAPADLLAQANELGLATLGVPDALDGAASEPAAVTGVLVAEALARGDLGLTVAALAPAAVSTALGLWGDADQQATYLPAFVGDTPPAAAFAVLEDRPLFDPFVLRTTAHRDGTDFVLKGAKALVPLAQTAELLLVAADIGGRGPGLFLVDSAAEGVQVEAEPAMGVRAAVTGRVTFDRVRVPEGALLGEADPAIYAAAIHRARLAWCAVSLGCARAVLDYVIPYVNERVAFGEPISHRQAVAFTVSDIAIELEGMRLTTYRAASRADRGKPFAHEAALARVLCADKGVAIGSEGVQLLGGHGYVKEHPVERWYRDLRAAGVMEGALLV